MTWLKVVETALKAAASAAAAGLAIIKVIGYVDKITPESNEDDSDLDASTED